MSVTRILVVCLLAVVLGCSCAEEAGTDRPNVHKDNLVNKEHFPEGEHDEEYDHEAFLGDQKEEFDELSPEEAKKRLKVLAKKVDKDEDGFVSEQELTTWVETVFKNRMLDGVGEDFKEKDTDSDGKVNWEEYKKSSYGQDELEDEDEEMKEMVSKDERRFDTADKDKDGKLSLEEFGPFMHPESSEDMADLHVTETMEGKIPLPSEPTVIITKITSSMGSRLLSRLKMFFALPVLVYYLVMLHVLQGCGQIFWVN